MPGGGGIGHGGRGLAGENGWSFGLDGLVATGSGCGAGVVRFVACGRGWRCGVEERFDRGVTSRVMLCRARGSAGSRRAVHVERATSNCDCSRSGNSPGSATPGTTMIPVHCDFNGRLAACRAQRVESCVVGAHTLPAHGWIRATKDLEGVRPVERAQPCGVVFAARAGVASSMRRS